MTIIRFPVERTRRKAVYATAGNLALALNQPEPAKKPRLGLVKRNPTEFVYTSQSGEELFFNTEGKVEKIQSRTGDQILITEQGLTHSAGKSIQFVREPATGRITQIIDPAGKSLNYGYTGNLLTSVTDRENQTTTFEYSPENLLAAIIGPDGVKIMAAEYDTAGRLIGTADASGAQSEFQHNIAARTETMVNRLGEEAIYTYDSEGSVLSITDASGTKYMVYDEFQNLTAEQDQLGRITRHTYNDRDQRTSTTDALGNVTLFELDAFGNVTKTTDALGRAVENVFDNFGQKLSSRDALGFTTNFTYHENIVRGIPFPGRGPLKSVTDPLGAVTEYPRYEGGQPVSMRDALGNLTLFEYNLNGQKIRERKDVTLSSGLTIECVTEYAYDANSRLVQTKYPDGSITKIEYNELGRKKASVDAAGNRTEYFYDDQARLQMIKHPDFTTQKFNYDLEGRRTGTIDQLNHLTSLDLDALGRPTKTTLPGLPLAFTQTFFDSAGQVIRTVDANNNAATYEYDSASRRIGMIDALGNARQFMYDSVGNQTALVNENGFQTIYIFDSANHEVQIIFPDSTVAETAFDSMGRTVLVRDQNGNEIVTRFDLLGRLLSRTDALGHTERFEYNEVGNLTAYIDNTGDRIKFEVDKMGRRTRAELPGGQVYRWTHDAAGNVATFTDPKGFVTTYTHDNMNRRTRDDFDNRLPDADIVRIYTATGKPKAIERSIDGEPWTIEYEYNDRDQRSRMITSVDALDYTHDAHGNLLTIRSDKKGLLVTYRYTALNRVKEAEDGQGRVTKYTYDFVGNIKIVAYPNGVKQTITYDPMNRPMVISWTNSTGEILRQQFVLDNVGNRLQSSEIGKSRNWTYDDIYRLTSEQVSDPNLTSGGGVLGYTYDFDQNRAQRNSSVAGIPGQSFTYNGNDEIIGQSYDLNGSVTTSAGGTALVYSAMNELVDFGGQVTFGYDGLGQRVKRTSGGVTTWYLWDDLNPSGFPQVLVEYEGAIPQTAMAKRVYTYGHRLISQRDEIGGQTSFFVADVIGTTRLLTDEFGGAASTFDFDAFGNIIRQTGTRTTNMLFAGEYRDAEVGGLYYLRARFYDPTSGRFVQRDPIFFNQIGQLAAFAYTDNQPVNRTDPTGLFSFSLGEQLVAGVNIGILANTAVIAFSTILADVAVTHELPLFHVMDRTILRIAQQFNGGKLRPTNSSVPMFFASVTSIPNVLTISNGLFGIAYPAFIATGLFDAKTDAGIRAFATDLGIPFASLPAHLQEPSHSPVFIFSAVKNSSLSSSYYGGGVSVTRDLYIPYLWSTWRTLPGEEVSSSQYRIYP